MSIHTRDCLLLVAASCLFASTKPYRREGPFCFVTTPLFLVLGWRAIWIDRSSLILAHMTARRHRGNWVGSKEDTAWALKRGTYVRALLASWSGIVRSQDRISQYLLCSTIGLCAHGYNYYWDHIPPILFSKSCALVLPCRRWTATTRRGARGEIFPDAIGIAGWLPAS
jgi:hypothetical protein